MQLFNAIAFSALLVNVSLAQRIFINLPIDDASFEAGTEVIVRVDKPTGTSGARESGFALGLQLCGEEACQVATDSMGTIIYNGPYTPTQPVSWIAPHQNFTVTIPADAPKGKAQFSIARLAISGASNWPYFDVTTKTIIVT